MNTSIKAIQSIADTLPIALYAKRRIPLIMSETEKTSFFDPVSDSITISYSIIQKGLQHMDENADLEEAVRSMLYHEVSHSVLTPHLAPMTDILNIFEDERIETLLSNYYLNVNFKKQVYAINGFSSNADIPTPTSAKQAFYNLVRFHIGDFDMLRKVKNIIAKYAKMNRSSPLYSSWYNDNNPMNWCDYQNEVNALYREVADQFKQNPENFTPPMSGNSSSSSSSETGEGNPTSDTNGEQAKSFEVGQNGNPTSDTNGEQAKNSEQEQDSKSSAESAEQGEAGGQASPFNIGQGNGQSFGDSLFADACKCGFDSKTYNTLYALISSFNKKNNSGSALRAYSGVINPRNLRYNDYKIFERKASVNGENRFGTFHLNLFLDNSGSFENNKDIVNGLLSALAKLERTFPCFSFSVVHCGCGERLITDKTKYALDCTEGTYLDYDAIDLYRKLNLPNTMNRTIVLYDGSCYYSRYFDAFKAFNHSDCTIISDPDNEKQIREYAPSAKQIITQNYTENLLDNVIKAIATAFR